MLFDWIFFCINQYHKFFKITMSILDIKSTNPDQYPPPREDEEALALHRDWTEAEENMAKRK
jgi:hypothetical protein